MSRILVVGGSDAGISAGLCARELDPDMEVTVLLADRFPNFSICGLPYFLSREVPDWHSLAHRTTDELAATGIELLVEHTAERIDPRARVVTVSGRDKKGQQQLRYDTLVVATGAVPVAPPIPGIERAGVHQLHTIGDSLVLDEALGREPEAAVIVGAGYIGLEMAEALRTRGLAVTVVEQLPTVLPTVDPELGALVRAELEQMGVRVVTGATVTTIADNERGLAVHTNAGAVVDADIVLVVVGVRPDTTLGQAAGIQTSSRGALRVNRRMQTNLPNVFAAGDCVATYHRLLGTDGYLPLGTTAHKQGRIAGENAVGCDRLFEGTVGTQVVKVFELSIARTGLRDHEALAGLNDLDLSYTPPFGSPWDAVQGAAQDWLGTVAAA